MPDAVLHEAILSSHPDTPCDAVRRVAARIGRTPDGNLDLTFVMDAHIDRLRVPPPGPPRIADRLWRHTCCEVLMARKGSSAYHEFNFSPSGEWAAYAFENYRAGMPLDADADAQALDPRVTVRTGASRLELDAVIPLGRLSPMHPAAALVLSVAAVIEDRDGVLSYWALRHPPGRPDFHHAAAFALELACPDRRAVRVAGRRLTP